MEGMQVLIGREIINAIPDSIRLLQHRDQHSLINNYLNEAIPEKVCVLYGLRRTGKTALMLKSVLAMTDEQINKCAFISFKEKTKVDMDCLYSYLEQLKDNGIKYVFIDEVTFIKDFENKSLRLTSICEDNMHIILAGTNSLSFMIADHNNTLFDKPDEIVDAFETEPEGFYFIPTTHIPYAEYEKLFNESDIDIYIKKGGLFESRIVLDINSLKFNEVIESECPDKYLNKAISRNIQHALLNDNFKKRKYSLDRLVCDNTLTNVINRVVHYFSHKFTLDTILRKFSIEEINNTIQILERRRSFNLINEIKNTNVDEITSHIKQVFGIMDKEECNITITDNDLDNLKGFLEDIDMIKYVPYISYKRKHDKLTTSEKYIFTQPGLRYSQTQETIDRFYNSAKCNDYFRNNKKALDDIIYLMDTFSLGHILEEIILFETMKSTKNKHIDKTNTYDVFQFFNNEGNHEIDMIVSDKQSMTCSLYEIKHSGIKVEEQCKHLVDDLTCKIIEDNYGEIISKTVLYRGENEEMDKNGVAWRNVENYLQRLYDEFPGVIPNNGYFENTPLGLTWRDDE